MDYKQIKAVLWERLGLGLLEYPVPKHTNTLPYSLGGITLIGFIILGITGFLLAQFYDPSPSGAYNSLEYIMGQAYLGWFIRGLHYWTAQIVMITIVLHVIRILITASYKKPREFTFFIGIALLATTYMGSIYTGTVLKWDQEGSEALAHSVELAEQMGPLGAWFTPSFTESTSLLARVFGLHVSLLPLILFALILVHFFLVKAHKISPLPWKKEGEEPAGELPKFTSHLRTLTKDGAVLLLIVSVLALVIAPPLGAQPADMETGIKPWWMYLWVYALEDVFGLNGILYGTTALFSILFLLPLLDRGEERDPRRRKVAMVFLALALIALVVLAFYGYTSPLKVHV